MAPGQALHIARAYLPEHPLGNRWDYYYSRAKLSSDPLYPGVSEALRGTDAPLLDLGCGLGLLAHTLYADGIRVPYRGVDSDAAKIRRAVRAAAKVGLKDTRFDTMDLSRELPSHRGNVVILDVLQFIPYPAQAQAIDKMIAMLTPGAKLVIRTGLDDGTGRARITRAVDLFSRALGWMNAMPRYYPDGEALRARLLAAGLQVEFTPLFGRTPFNNWRIVASK
ncbi:methyltransferase domain-containing protein [Lysobacter capsici]|uniref:methyltransferase domain-containing protein n=1 Tax=Lysobacter capsici TaxID=435897 RepID=UPI00287B7F68|nr:methyltransferase domain-containing protein [Lysobacter capsici]WND81283.1 methyltransferase domain-containing protein [Lysobacter capsici]WND86479.1 methyltransferase domain-containing protein [Lysobacter capsici]